MILEALSRFIRKPYRLFKKRLPQPLAMVACGKFGNPELNISTIESSFRIFLAFGDLLCNPELKKVRITVYSR